MFYYLVHYLFLYEIVIYHYGPMGFCFFFFVPFCIKILHLFKLVCTTLDIFLFFLDFFSHISLLLFHILMRRSFSGFIVLPLPCGSSVYLLELTSGYSPLVHIATSSLAYLCKPLPFCLFFVLISYFFLHSAGFSILLNKLCGVVLLITD